LEPTEKFGLQKEVMTTNRHSLSFILKYLKEYRKYLFQIFLGLLFGCVLQLTLPFLTQAIVDIGIKKNDIDFILLVLLGELVIILSKASIDFIRRWLLLHISTKINISLISDFFIKLLKLPMSYFDSKLMGDLMQRVSDHGRIQSFLTNQILSVIFAFLTFIVFGVVLFIYNHLVFSIFVVGSVSYGIWVSLFLQKRKVLDYELFEKEAINQSKTYQFLTSIQEIKLQNCEKRRRWEWEDTQADLYGIRMKTLKLQQTQETGSLVSH
jgi:ATP-binding cassette subfamily B protein